MEIDAAFKADAQLVHPCEPGKCALDDPAMTAQTVVALDPLAGDPRNAAALPEVVAAASDVVCLVGVQFVWSASSAPCFAANRRQSRDPLLEHHRLVAMGASDTHR